MVAYLASRGQPAIGVGRAVVTIEQLDLQHWPHTERPGTESRRPPWGNCQNPLLLRFYDDPDVWTLAAEELGPETRGCFVSEEEPPSAAFIRAHQQALLIHGGRYGLYEVYRIDNPDDPPEHWQWEKLAYLNGAEIRRRILDALQRQEGFDGRYRQVIERTARDSVVYREVPDAELVQLAGAMRALCEQYMARLATLEEAYHHGQPQAETPDSSTGA